MSADKAYPLAWPTGWPRTISPVASKFNEHTPYQALEEISRQLELMGAKQMVISSNYTLGANPKDKGVCVYFKLKEKPYALPCDKWNAVEDNLWALAKHLEALRGQERWGVGTIERAFAGYVALPAPAGTNPEEWWTVLGCAREATFAVVSDAYKNKAMLLHPDRGGDSKQMATLNEAWAIAKRALGAK